MIALEPRKFLTVWFTLVLQVAVKVNSVESQSCEKQERPNSSYLPSQPPSPLSTHSPSFSPLPYHSSSPSSLSLPPCSLSPSPLPPSPSSPSPLSLMPSTPSLLLPPPPSPRLPSRSGSLRRPRASSAISHSDLADEEVYHINSSASCIWRDEEGGEQESRRKAGRSHSLSPYTLPCPLNLNFSSLSPPHAQPPSFTRSANILLKADMKDTKKGYRVDSHGFLDKLSPESAGYSEDQRRHSIEICLPQTIITSDSQQFTTENNQLGKGTQVFPMRVQSFGSSHRKEKTSPPCISIHPPSEKEHPRFPSPPKLADCSMMLRRRTPSGDMMPQSNLITKDMSTDIRPQMQTPLTPIYKTPQVLPPTHRLTPTPTHTPLLASLPTPSNIPTSPNVFIQPHAPLLPTVRKFSQTHPLSSAARHTPLAGECIPEPQFTFDQPQPRYVSSLSAAISDPDPATCSSPFDSRLGSSAGFSAKNRRTAQ